MFILLIQLNISHMYLLKIKSRSDPDLFLKLF